MARLQLIATSPTDPWNLGTLAQAADRLKLLLMLCEARQSVLDCASLLAANQESGDHIRGRLAWQLHLVEQLGIQLEFLGENFPKIQRAASGGQQLPDFVMSPIVGFRFGLFFRVC